MCLYKFGARDSWLNNWEHRGEDMYGPRALLKIPGSGTTLFFFPLRTPLSVLWKQMPYLRWFMRAFLIPRPSLPLPPPPHVGLRHTPCDITWHFALKIGSLTTAQHLFQNRFGPKADYWKMIHWCLIWPQLGGLFIWRQYTN